MVTYKKYNVSVSVWDYDKGKVITKDIFSLNGYDLSVAKIRKDLLKKYNKVGTQFTIYDALEPTNDPYTVKWKGKWVTLGVNKGECTIYYNGIFWITYNEKTKKFKKYKLNKDGTINGERKF